MSAETVTTALPELVAELLDRARGTSAGRGARTVHGGRDHRLRQTAVALLAGHGLDEHDTPEEATLQVLHGRVELTWDGGDWQGGPGDLVTIPPHRHALNTHEDSAVLLTVLARG